MARKRQFFQTEMQNVVIEGLTFKPYLLESQIEPEIKRVAREIERDLGDLDPLFICILNGAFMFASDLTKELEKPYELSFAKYSSYNGGLCSTGVLNEVMKPQADLTGRTVVILEDLIDTGFTLTKVVDLYMQRGAKEVKIAVMLSKPDAHKDALIRPDYVGLEIPNDFILGRGLDYMGRGRMFRDIYVKIDTEEEV